MSTKEVEEGDLRFFLLKKKKKTVKNELLRSVARNGVVFAVEEIIDRRTIAQGKGESAQRQNEERSTLGPDLLVCLSHREGLVLTMCREYLIYFKLKTKITSLKHKLICNRN